MKKNWKYILFGLVIIIVAGAVYGYLLYNKPHRDVLKSKTDYTISASELLKEFETNSTLASEKYIGKILLVSGNVESIKVSPSNSTIQLSCEGGFFGVNCSFNSEGATNLLEIKIGNEIQLKGECSGYIDDVILNNCYLIK
jgi:hypothetical protein